LRILWLGWEDLYTPNRMYSAATTLGIDLCTVEIWDLSFITADNVIGVYYQNKSIVDEYDVLIARTFYPFISEALTVARLFHTAGKMVIDASLADEGFVVSKMHDYLILAQHGLPVPRTWQITDPAKISALASQLGYPCVLKGIHGSHGTHVHLVNNTNDIATKLASYSRGELMLQEYLPANEDYRLMVVGYRTLPLMVSREPTPGDFRTNVGLGHSVAAHRVADFDGLGTIAQEAASVLRREFAGVDIRFHKGKPVVLEVNRRPIFENFERVTDLDVAGQFLQYVVDKWKSNESRAG
jgi:RimK family alpha-L-glutamate ligase